MAYDWHETVATKDRPEYLLRVDEPAFRRALLRPKFVVLATQVRVRQRLVRDRDLLEPLLRVRVVAVLVRMVLDGKSAWSMRRSQPPQAGKHEVAGTR